MKTRVAYLDGSKAPRRPPRATKRITTWTRKRRYGIFDWISAYARDTFETKWEMSDLHVRAKTWRKAVVAWLRCQQLIKVSRKPKPLPHFNPQKRS